MEKEKILKFLGKFFDVSLVSEDDNIFEKGMVNSLFAMQLVTFLEDEFDISISNDELSLENFSSIHSITSLVERKLG